MRDRGWIRPGGMEGYGSHGVRLRDGIMECGQIGEGYLEADQGLSLHVRAAPRTDYPGCASGKSTCLTASPARKLWHLNEEGIQAGVIDQRSLVSIQVCPLSFLEIELVIVFLCSLRSVLCVFVLFAQSRRHTVPKSKIRPNYKCYQQVGSSSLSSRYSDFGHL